MQDAARRSRRWTFQAPTGPVAVLVGVMVAVFLVMMARIILLHASDWRDDWGTSGAAVQQGRWLTLFTSIFLHGGIVHLWLNMSALITLGGPVSMRFGGGVRAALWFYALFFVCGLAGSLTFVALNWNGQLPMIGASGAIFGLWAAFARLGGGGSWNLLPMLHPYVRSQIAAAVLSNIVIIALLWVVGTVSGGQAIGLAWEAHLGGFVAGFFLTGPFLRLAGQG